MENTPPATPPPETQPTVGGSTVTEKSSAFSKGKALYEKFLPPGSPQRKFGPLILATPVLVLLLLAKCAFSAGSEKVTEAIKAHEETLRVESTGILVVKLNRPNATVEALRAAAAGEPAATPVKGAEEGAAQHTLRYLPPGKYALTARAEGWPEVRAEVDVPAGRTTEITVNFPSGSLRLDTVPAGASVRLGKTELGKTPLTIPQLPVGEISLSLGYAAWPAVTAKVVIAENTEAVQSVRLPHGRLTVDSVPKGAHVVYGGKTFKATPLFFDPVPAGPVKVTLEAKGFPPMEVSVTVADGQEAKIRPYLGSVFPVLDPAEFLRAVWIASDPSKMASDFNQTTGIYRPKNDVVKNIHRERLYNRWQHKNYRFSGPVKSYDAASGRLEFAEQKSELSRYRVIAQVAPGTNPLKPVQKDAKDKEPVVLTVYGTLTAVEEPVWPGRVITLELTDADFLPDP
jgi:PEGA domain